MEANENDESCVNRPRGRQMGHDKCTKLWRWYQTSSKDSPVCWRTSIPSKARTVSLLASFALRSPTLPIPLSGVAKCKLMEALESPAEMAQRDLNDALRHNAATRRPGKKSVLRRGEIVSRIMAASLSMSAKRNWLVKWLKTSCRTVRSRAFVAVTDGSLTPNPHCDLELA